MDATSAKADATSGELRAEIEALRLAQETDDFSFVSPTGKQYETLLDSKIDAWLAYQCGLVVMAARRGIPQTDDAALGVQWDARFSVLCPAEWEQPPPSALMGRAGGARAATAASAPPPDCACCAAGGHSAIEHGKQSHGGAQRKVPGVAAGCGRRAGCQSAASSGSEPRASR